MAKNRKREKNCKKGPFLFLQFCIFQFDIAIEEDPQAGVCAQGHLFGLLHQIIGKDVHDGGLNTQLTHSHT